MRDELNPMVLRGSPYADDAVDRVAEVDIPALAEALKKLGPTTSVAEARAEPERLPITSDERRQILDQAILVLSELYVHRDLKRTKHAVDPVAALRQLRRRCDTLTGYDFHLNVMRIFKGLRDIHTGYVMPKPYSDMVAFLPFLLGAYTKYMPLFRKSSEEILNEDRFDPSAERAVIVTGLLADFQHPHFRDGAEILSWNGLPIHEAIHMVGEEEQGSNVYAQFALGLRLMTVRWFGGSLPPKEYFVTIAYRSETDNKIREIRFPWRVMRDSGRGHRVASVQAMWDIKSKYENTADDDPSVERRSLLEGQFIDRFFMKPEEIPDLHNVTKVPIEIEGLPAGIFDVRKVRVHHTDGPIEFGLVKINNFVCKQSRFRDGFLKILNAIPQTGLVIDLRSNPGGLVKAAESVLQFLTPNAIRPLPFQFLASTLVEEVVKSPKSLALEKLRGWDRKVTPAVDTGNQFSRFNHLTDETEANALGQRYYGPVALITNAITYSSGDIFAASFQDHDIGPVIGVDPTTGGGGANMWEHRDCVDMAPAGRALSFLPGGARSGPKMHYAVRRCTRVGRNTGLPIEEEGVLRDERHEVSRDDLMDGDVDLMRSAARILRKRDALPYSVTIEIDGQPADMAAVDIVAPRQGDSAQIVIRIPRIAAERAGWSFEHVLEIDDVPRQTVTAIDGKAEIRLTCLTGRDTRIRVESHRFCDLHSRSYDRFAVMTRLVRFVDPSEG
jgi:hypothetical protein